MKKAVRCQHWKPFHAWLRGKLAGKPSLVMTYAEKASVQWILNRLATNPGIDLAAFERKLLVIANRILDRENIKPLSENEHGELRSKPD